MINQLNFTGTYRIDFQDSVKEPSCATLRLPEEIKASSYKSLGHLTYVVKDRDDSDIETFLKSNGMNFRKVSNEEIYSPECIKKRTIPHEYATGQGDEYSLVEVKTKRFDRVYDKTDIFRLSDNCDDSNMKSVRKYIKSAEDFQAPLVCIFEKNGEPVVRFIDGRHRYMVLKNMGFDSIPLTLDKKSVKIAKKHGLIC